jgi:hypothetical protein
MASPEVRAFPLLPAALLCALLVLLPKEQYLLWIPFSLQVVRSLEPGVLPRFWHEEDKTGIFFEVWGD